MERAAIKQNIVTQEAMAMTFVKFDELATRLDRCGAPLVEIFIGMSISQNQITESQYGTRP